MINAKDFEKAKTTKPAGELTPNDVGSLIKIIDVNGVELKDVLIGFVAGNRNTSNGHGRSDTLDIRLQHSGVHDDEYGRFRHCEVPRGMSVVVQRPIVEEQ